MKPGRSHLVFRDASSRTTHDSIRGMAFSHDSTRLAFCDFAGRLGIFDGVVCNKKDYYSNHSNNNNNKTAEVQEGYCRFITNSKSKPQSGEEVESMRSQAVQQGGEEVSRQACYDMDCNAMFEVSWRHDDSQIVAASNAPAGKKFVLVDTKTYHEVTPKQTPSVFSSVKASFYASKFSPKSAKNGKDYFAIAGESGFAVLFDADTHEEISRTPQLPGNVLGLDFNCDATKIALLQNTHDVTVFDISNPQNPEIAFTYSPEPSTASNIQFWNLGFMKSSSSSSSFSSSSTTNFLCWPGSKGLNCTNVDTSIADNTSTKKSSVDATLSLNKANASHWAGFIGKTNLFALLGQCSFQVFKIISTKTSPAEIHPLFAFDVSSGNSWSGAISPNGGLAAFCGDGRVSIHLLELAEFFWQGRKAAWKIRDLVPENTKCRLSQLFKEEYAPFFIVNKYLA